MSLFQFRPNYDALVRCAPITERPGIDRAMRVAIQRVRRSKQAAMFGQQQAFDRSIAKLVQDIPADSEVEGYLAKEAIGSGKRSWKRIIMNPAVAAAAMALAVIGGVFAYRVHEHLNDFPGAEAGRHLLSVAASTRSVLLDPLQTEAGALSDLFFMKHRLEHYDIPIEFADYRTLGCRVFDDEEVQRVAQIWIVEKRMQLFLFPAEKDPKGKIAPDFSEWRYVENEGWIGAMQQHNGICFMVATRGHEENLKPYLGKKKE